MVSDLEGLEQRLAARVGRAIGDYELIEPGARTSGLVEDLAGGPLRRG